MPDTNCNVRTRVWPQRWLQFSLRSFLIAMVLVVLPLSWLGRRIDYVSRQQRAASKIMEQRGGVLFNYEELAARTTRFPIPAAPAPPSKNRLMTWLDEKVLAEALGVVGTGNNLYGIMPLADVSQQFKSKRAYGFSAGPFECQLLVEFQGLRWLHFGMQPLNDTDLESISKLTKLEYLDANDCSGVTDSGLKHLRRLRRLRFLRLRHGHFTDEGLQQLSHLSRLESLTLSDNRITDAGLRHLKNLTNLQSLELADTQVTDDGLAQLAILTNLQRLSLRDTKVTDAGLIRLSGLRSLSWLSLEGTEVTFEAANAFEHNYSNSLIVR